MHENVLRRLSVISKNRPLPIPHETRQWCGIRSRLQHCRAPAAFHMTTRVESSLVVTAVTRSASLARGRNFSSTARTNNEVKDVAILGGGITGLATAHYLAEEYPDVGITLYESKPYLGGWMNSKVVDVGNGQVIFESGPRSLRPQAPNGTLALRLVRCPCYSRLYCPLLNTTLCADTRLGTDRRSPHHTEVGGCGSKSFHLLSRPFGADARSGTKSVEHWEVPHRRASIQGGYIRGTLGRFQGNTFSINGG